MKIRNRIAESILGGIALLLTACSGSLPADVDTGSTDSPGTPDEKGEPINITFDMESAIQTRTDGSTTTGTDEKMGDGKTFNIYVYDMAGITSIDKLDFSAPLASSTYTVNNVEGNLVATGNLKLYRGTYYMYLVSYNSDSEQPLLGKTSATNESTGTDAIINVVNGKDFMYTTLPNVVVQPQSSGSGIMSVKLPSPFQRLGSQVVVRTTAKASSPVPVKTLEVDNITINGLHNSLDYSLRNFNWKSNTTFDASHTIYGKDFTLGGGGLVTDYWTSTPNVLLPVDGNALLTFEVTLRISYQEGGADKTITPTYTASMQKVLMPGMTYQFDFLLTFYGEIIPADLTLAVKEYNEIKLDSDGLGAD